MNNCKDKKIIKTFLTNWHKLTRIKISEMQFERRKNNKIFCSNTDK